MKALLQMEELWVVIERESEAVLDKKKDQKAFSKIILAVDKTNYSHLKASTTAKDAWESLESTFDSDSGLEILDSQER